MTTNELKQMITEEYSRYLKEQAAAPTPPVPTPGGPGGPGGPAGAPKPPTPPMGGPGVTVGPDDIDVIDDGGDSEEMLQNIFNMLKTHFDDMDDDMGDEEEEVAENSVGPNAGYKSLKESSVSRMQKLANIRK